MGTTATFIKSRSASTPKVNEWNINFNKAIELAKKDGKPVIVIWSNGDNCGYCVNAEKCMMDKVFTDWMKTSDCYFVFQYSGDKDKGQTTHDWIYKGTKLKYYPGFRVVCYDVKTGKTIIDTAIEGNSLRESKTGTTGAKNMVKNLNTILTKKPSEEDVTPDVQPVTNYKVRLNEKLTVKKVNSILDAIDENNGYCPCQPKGDGTKCHCEDFLKNKKLDEPCICNIYIKKAK